MNTAQSLYMAELLKIQVCQAPMCQEKGSKTILHRFHEAYGSKYMNVFPQLQIEAWDCAGECEQGPVVKVNETMLFRQVEKDFVAELFENSAKVLGDVQNVQEKDKDAFDRIIKGELY